LDSRPPDGGLQSDKDRVSTRKELFVIHGRHTTHSNFRDVRRRGFLCVGAVCEVLVISIALGLVLAVIWQSHTSLWSRSPAHELAAKGDTKAIMDASINYEQQTLLVLSWRGELKTISLETGVTSPRCLSKNLVTSVTSARNSTTVSLAEWAEDLKIHHQVEVFRGNEFVLSELVVFEPLASASIGVSDDGQTVLLISSEGDLVAWDLSQPTPVRRDVKTDQPTHRCQLSPDGRLLLAAPTDGKIFVCDTRTGATRMELRDEGFDCRSMAWSADGKRFAVGYINGTIRLFDADQGTPIWEDRLAFEFARSITLSKDGRYLASGGFDNTIRVWETTNSRKKPLELTGQAGLIRCLCFTEHDKTLISGSLDGTIHEWSLAEGKSLRRLQ
jgi:WD40 repeat protein